MVVTCRSVLPTTRSRSSRPGKLNGARITTSREWCAAARSTDRPELRGASSQGAGAPNGQGRAPGQSAPGARPEPRDLRWRTETLAFRAAAEVNGQSEKEDKLDRSAIGKKVRSVPNSNYRCDQPGTSC